GSENNMNLYVKYADEKSRPRIVTMHIFRQMASISSITFSYDVELRLLDLFGKYIPRDIFHINII
ncbi:hypothetical protein QOZ60_30730, partial [Pseudomonas aeruginosa]|uniref:hypothetical protein n=1 Tax=Pseudomonas aeruginosa TaxID=287 RepID=UPI0034589FBE